MTAILQPGIRRYPLRELAWQGGLPLIYLLAMYLFFPYWNLFWLVYDEGYNMLKARLVEQGYSLYAQIWNDQAPLLTHLLAWLFEITGNEIIWSRRLILIFSALLLWALVQYLRIAWGNLPALISAVVLVLLPNFLVLSTAVLVGQPSLALGMLSLLALAGWHRKRKRAFLILSALALSLSLLTKLFTVFLAPIFLIGLLGAEFSRFRYLSEWRKVIKPALIWGSSLGAITLGLGLLMIRPVDVLQLFQPHVSAALSTDYPANVELNSINYYLRPAWPMLLGALFSVLFVWRERRWLMLYPLAWMIVAYLALLVFQPVWWHHQVLVTIPAAMLAGGAFGESLGLFFKKVRKPVEQRKLWLIIISNLIIMGLTFATLLPIAVDYLHSAQKVNADGRDPAQERFMKRIEVYAPQTKWMVTDEPMFAFRAGISVPPNLAVISWKRFAAGDLTEDEILQTLRQLRPEQVFFGRFDLPKVNQYLAENYRETLHWEEMNLYVRNDLQK
jgi:4-amino-4-deoxy-L-arabinose transferase-like glycosyltransferase